MFKGVLMKELLLVTIFIASTFVARAQEVEETEVFENEKEEMVDRSKDLIKEVKKMRADLRDNKKKEACARVNDIMELYKLQVMDVGMHMEASKARRLKVANKEVEQLAFFHKLKNRCELGEKFEFINSEETADNLTKVVRSLRSHKRKIKRDDADENNSFSYKYNFNETIVH